MKTTKWRRWIESLPTTALLATITVLLLSGCNDSKDHIVGTTPTTPDEPIITIPNAQTAIHPVSADCQSNSLCQFAADAANQLSQTPENTCYAFESRLVGQSSNTPNIALNNENPFAFVSTSGWLHYALNQTGGNWAEALQEIDGHKEADTPWARSHVYHQLFTDLINGAQNSNLLHADNDINNLAPGDLLTWCEKSGCSDDVNEPTDTGYGGIVVHVEPVTMSNIEARLRLIPTNAAFFKVGIVSANHQVHGSLYSSTQQIADHRHQSGPLKNAACDQNGGLGAGAILLAQWQDEQNQLRWSFALYDNSNHQFNYSNQPNQFALSFARVNP